MGESKKNSHISLCALFPDVLQQGGSADRLHAGKPTGAEPRLPSGSVGAAASWHGTVALSDTLPHAKNCTAVQQDLGKNLCPLLRSRHGAGQSILQGCRLTSIAQDGFFCPKKSSGRGYTCSELAVQATTSHLLEQHGAGVLPRDKWLWEQPQ